MDKRTYSWSSNDETYIGEFDSIEEALLDAFDTLRGQDVESVQIGENYYVDARRLVNADTLIDELQDTMYQIIGESADAFLTSVSAEKKAELAELIGAWVRSADSGKYWEVRNATFHCFAAHGLTKEAE